MKDLQEIYKQARASTPEERQKMVGQLRVEEASLKMQATLLRESQAKINRHYERQPAWMGRPKDDSEEMALGMETEALGLGEVAKRITLMDLAPDFQKFMADEAADHSSSEFWQNRAKQAAEQREQQVSEYAKNGLKPTSENSNTFVKDGE